MSILRISAKRTTTTYYADGQTKARINPLAIRTTHVYDKATRQIATIDGENHRISTVYDATGQSTASINALAYRTTQVYDPAGRRIRMTDANNHINTFLFDAAGQDLGSIDPLNRRTTYGYDPAGNQDLKVTANGDRITITYDGNNRQTEQRSNGIRYTFAFDPAGNRTLMHDPTGRTTSTYDGRNLTLTVTNPVDKVITYSYSGTQQRSRMIDPDSGRFTYTQNAADLLVLVKNPQNEVTTLAYDDANRIKEKTLGNGTVAKHSYDDAGRLTRLANLDSTNTTLSSFLNTYDDVDNRTQVVEANGDVVTWTYVCPSKFWSHSLPNYDCIDFGLLEGFLPNYREFWKTHLRRPRATRRSLGWLKCPRPNSGRIRCQIIAGWILAA